MNQKLKWTGWILLAAVFFVDLYLLVTGSSYLEYELSGSDEEVFPLGTLVGWSFMVAWPLLFLLLLPVPVSGQPPVKFKVLRVVRLLLLAALILALGWGFCGRLASGNWAFNFYNAPRAWQLWMFWSAAILFLPLTAFLAWSFAWLFLRSRTRRG